MVHSRHQSTRIARIDKPLHIPLSTPAAHFTALQSVTYRYREFFIILVVSEKIGAGISLGSGIGKNLVPEKIFVAIYNGYRYCISTGTEKFLYFLVVSEKFGTEKKNW